MNAFAKQLEKERVLTLTVLGKTPTRGEIKNKSYEIVAKLPPITNYSNHAPRNGMEDNMECLSAHCL